MNLTYKISLYIMGEGKGKKTTHKWLEDAKLSEVFSFLDGPKQGTLDMQVLQNLSKFP